MGLARGYFLKYTISVFCCFLQEEGESGSDSGPTHTHTHTHTVGPEATGGLILSPRRPPSSSAAPQRSILKTSCWPDLCADVSAGPARVCVCSLPDSRFFFCVCVSGLYYCTHAHVRADSVIIQSVIARRSNRSSRQSAPETILLLRKTAEKMNGPCLVEKCVLLQLREMSC